MAVYPPHLGQLKFWTVMDWNRLVLKGKLRHSKNFKSFLSKNQFKSGNAKPDVVRIPPQTEARGKNYIEKVQRQRKEMIDWL